MNAPVDTPHLPAPSWRSEAFAEDVEGLLSDWEPVVPERRRGRLLLNLLPLAVAVAGVAFAVLPPLG
jgi:hypothetical protein